MQYIPPVMVIVGLCSMNKEIIPFPLSKAGFLIISTVVILIYSSLPYMISHVQEDSKWRAEMLGKLYEIVLIISTASQSFSARFIAFAWQRFGRSAQTRTWPA
jgi:hypothetical protein